MKKNQSNCNLDNIKNMPYQPSSEIDIFNKYKKCLYGDEDIVVVHNFTGKNMFNSSYMKKPIPIKAYQTDNEVEIETLEGIMKAHPGDYIITGVNGEKYPCKKDIFEKTYTKAPSNYIERMIHEKNELDLKIGKLEKWLEDNIELSTDLEDIELKQNQLKHMIPYSNILKIRIEKALDSKIKNK